MSMLDLRPCKYARADRSFGQQLPCKRSEGDQGLAAKASARLRDSQGFMLAEQLMSVMFIGFLSLVIAAGLGVCISVQRNISVETSSQVLLTRAIQEVNDQLEYSGDVQDDGATFVSSSMHQPVRFSSVDGEGIYLTRQDASKDKTLLVGENSGMVALFQVPPAYDASDGTWAYSLNIMDGSGTVVKSQEVTVKRLGSAEASN